MAKNKDYIPRQDDTLVLFLQTFNDILPSEAAALQLSAQEVADLQADNDAMIAAIEKVNAAKTALKAAAAEKDTLRRSFEKAFRKTANIFKNKQGYTEAVGVHLGITGHEKVWNADTASPLLKIQVVGEQVILKFNKAQSTGIHIWSRRGGEEVFSFLAQRSRSPYYDKRPNLVDGVPERREYFAYYISKDDEPVGQQSNIVSVMV